MKEAAGEANLTVVAIILIGVIAAIVTPIISNMMKTTQIRACCMDAGGVLKGSGSDAECVDGKGDSIDWDPECGEAVTGGN